ncbi:oxidoreductase [Pseudomonas putida]
MKIACIGQVPKSATEADLAEVCEAFVQAAQRSAQAGFDWLEIQAGHGFLLSSFLSPLTNQGTD